MRAVLGCGEVLRAGALVGGVEVLADLVQGAQVGGSSPLVALAVAAGRTCWEAVVEG